MTETRVSFELRYRWSTKPDLSAPRRPASPVSPAQANVESYRRRARSIIARHDAQDPEAVIALRRKYEAPLLGPVRPWQLVEMLARCVDPTDERLFCASQQIHVLQIIEAMENDGAATEEFLLAALVHDLGKVLLLAGEAPENVVGMNRPIRTAEPGAGLDQCLFQWNHDEFAYSRLKEHLPEGIAWLVRYHSIVPGSCEVYMNARDREYAERYLRPFARYDHRSKSPYFLPERRIEDYRHIVEQALPATIVF